MMPQHTTQETRRWLSTTALALCLLFVPLVSFLSPSAARAGTVPCDCTSCHGQKPAHGNCWTCHPFLVNPSDSRAGSHPIHYKPFRAEDPKPSSLGYGNTTITSTADAYQFGCGNCHPLDPAKHRNGTVNVELYNASAPAGSLKAMNPQTADYTASTKTCKEVYCHSGFSVTSGPVSDPLETPPVYDLVTGNLSYSPPYTDAITESRVYATTPPWGTPFGQPQTCKECHAFPLVTYSPNNARTGYPVVSAGVGDSHQWIDDFGYANLHAYNMSYPPLACKTCHSRTVNVAGLTHDTSGPYGEEIVYEPVPVSSHATHVNGQPDVDFDTNNTVDYPKSNHTINHVDLTGAAYDPETKTCSQVLCHKAQTFPKWGAPYRWWDSWECNLCHRM